jgi:uncharacterized protein
MSYDVRDAFLQRVAEHVLSHSLEGVVLILHGGEPLLAGKDYVSDFFERARAIIPSACEIIFQVQTNGLAIDRGWVDLFAEYGVRVGVSLDGPREYNDTMRVSPDGRGSFDQTVAGLKKLLEHPHGDKVFGSVLSVANPSIPTDEFWKCWVDLGVKRFDLLLPMHTHENPPPFRNEQLTEWLITLFDLWWSHDDRSIDIRFYRNILNLMLGGELSTDYIGGRPTAIVVVETDGSIQPTDALRACENGMVDIKLNVAVNTFNDAMYHPFMAFGNHSASKLSDQCRDCAAVDVCGGGYLPQRYSSDRGFDNPSVFCESLFGIIRHIYGRVSDQLAAAGIQNGENP